jgi:hypothetical protein
VAEELEELFSGKEGENPQIIKNVAATSYAGKCSSVFIKILLLNLPYVKLAQIP